MRKIKRNTIPFIILFIIHSVLLGYTFYRNKNKKQLFTLLMSNIGFAYLFEYFVLNIFKGYTYKPKVIKKRFLDDIFGAILSQAIFVPFTAVYLTATKKGWKEKVITGGYFSIVELIFLNLGIYKHHWWKTVYTFILIPIYLNMSDVWNKFLNKNIPFVRFVSLFLMILVTEANLLFIFVLFRKLRFGRGRYHSWREHFILVPLHAIPISIFVTYSFLKENNLNAKIRALLFEIGLNTLFRKIKLLKTKISIGQLVMIKSLMTILYGLYRDMVFGKNDNDGRDTSVK